LPDPAIVVTTLSGDRLRRLGPGSRPAWSARGWISYISDGALYRVRPDGSSRRRLVARGCTAAAWSPDGSRLVFSTVPKTRRPRRYATDRGGVFIARADGTGLERLPPMPDDWQWATELAWSPDGRRLAVRAGSSLVTIGLRARVLQRFPEVASEWVYDGQIEVTRFRERTGIAWQPLPR
jgi:Tol biopolymer transport system component